MTEQRFRQIENLIEDAGRCFDPVTGQFEPVDEPGDDQEGPDAGFDIVGFLATLGITADECAEYVQRRLHDYDESFRRA